MPAPAELRLRRLDAIRELLARADVRAQEQIVASLAEAGFDVTQSSVSRDLKELGVAKVDGRYTLAAPETDDAEGTRRLRQYEHLLRAATPAGPNLTVVRTAVGAAPGVGLAIDAADWPEVVGTIAGDDTIFVATGDARGQAVLVSRLETLIDSRGKRDS